MTPIVKQCFKNSQISRLASVGILGKEREPGVGKLDWHGNFGTRFEMNYFVISFKIPCVGFLNLSEIATVLLVYGGRSRSILTFVRKSFFLRVMMINLISHAFL